MKILIIGDVHLGANLKLGFHPTASEMNSRLKDYFDTLISTLDDGIAKQCEILVFTGDIFEHRTPTVQQQMLFSIALNHAVSIGYKQIHIVVGNHDQQRSATAHTLSYIQELPLDNIFVHSEIESVSILDGDQEVHLTFLPYRDRKWYGSETNNEAIELIEQGLVRCASEASSSATKVLVGHMAVEGTMWMLEEYSDLYNGNDLILPLKLFNDFNITIMGHVHTPGLISQKPLVAYVGSMEKRGSFEDHDKKYVIIDVDEGKIAEFSEPCRDIFDFKIDVSDESRGELVTSEVLDRLKSLPDINHVDSNLVRVIVSVSSLDEKYLDAKAISTFLTDECKAFYCAEVRKVVILAKQNRNLEISEGIDDTEALKLYLQTECADIEFIDELVEIGTDIIKGD